ncbi:hypothetical protein BZA77DRAFT_170776 [Pyronema omphalodes]|nr:hypothetical protein BZA77DRAFT_170776 [Pyronema omphalodes]
MFRGNKKAFREMTTAALLGCVLKEWMRCCRDVGGLRALAAREAFGVACGRLEERWRDGWIRDGLGWGYVFLLLALAMEMILLRLALLVCPSVQVACGPCRPRRDRRFCCCCCGEPAKQLSRASQSSRERSRSEQQHTIVRCLCERCSMLPSPRCHHFSPSFFKSSTLHFHFFHHHHHHHHPLKHSSTSQPQL